ncbi:MAG: hypothetical protein KJ626_01270 [Verrucomicrobia bacterium]|nr:hypothetical protein [Verrucomicrobiota bacterium]
MVEVLAEYTGRSVSRGDGLGNAKCPTCGKILFELDVESYSDFESDRTVEVCADCREELERERYERLDCDVLDPLTFAKLWVWCVDRMEMTNRFLR